MRSGTLHEIDLRVPWVIRPALGLGTERGVRSGELASLIDVAPTLVDLFDLPPLSGVHGVSQLPSLRGTGPARKMAFAAGGVQRGYAVMTRDQTFLRVSPGSRGPSGLTRSWSGTVRPQRTSPEQEFIERATGRELDSEGDAANVLRDAGQEWFEWVAKARDAVHPVAWEREPLSEAELAELRERSLIAAED